MRPNGLQAKSFSGMARESTGIHRKLFRNWPRSSVKSPPKLAEPGTL